MKFLNLHDPGKKASDTEALAKVRSLIVDAAANADVDGVSADTLGKAITMLEECPEGEAWPFAGHLLLDMARTQGYAVLPDDLLTHGAVLQEPGHELGCGHTFCTACIGSHVRSPEIPAWPAPSGPTGPSLLAH